MINANLEIAVNMANAPIEEAALLQLAANDISEPLMFTLNFENFLHEFLYVNKKPTKTKLFQKF